MLTLLNALSASSAMFWLLVGLGILLIVEVAIFAIIAIAKKHQETKEKPRQAVGIVLNTEIVKREYKVGDKFDPSGLIVTVRYSDDPLEETIQEFTVVTPELVKKLANEDKRPEDLLGCRIYAPDLSAAGKPTVTVAFQDQTAAYAITVVDIEPVEVKPEPVTPQAEVNMVNYAITVTTPEELALQVALYNGNTQMTAAVNVEDGSACISAPAGDYNVKVFGLPEKGYEVKADLLSAKKLNATVTITYCVEPAEEVEEVVPTVTEVIEVVPEEVAPVAEEIAVTEVVEQAPVVIVEESVAGGTLRYDRSFTARLIQSDDEVKNWYTELKNELLSYKKVHDRMSWKRESYNYGRMSFAKLAYRGDTLCLYLPIDPDSLADSKYKVENVSDSASYQDTPCLYRIKNNKRMKYAKELIEIAAELVGTPKTERETQDYYLPYEGIVELINKGLVKRNIKTAADEAFFASSKAEN